MSNTLSNKTSKDKMNSDLFAGCLVSRCNSTYLVMRFDVKEKRWYHTNCLLSADVALDKI